MLIPDALWRELCAVKDRYESWTQFAGLLGIDDKTARAWIEDRTRDVRPHTLGPAVERMRSRLRAESGELHKKTEPRIGDDTETPQSTETSSSGRGTRSYPVIVAHEDGVDVPKPGEGVQMVLTRQQAMVMLLWQEHGFERAYEEIKQIALARSRLQRGGDPETT